VIGFVFETSSIVCHRDHGRARGEGAPTSRWQGGCEKTRTPATPALSGSRALLRSVREGDAAGRKRLGWHEGIERNYGHITENRSMTEGKATQWLDAVRSAEAPSTRHDQARRMSWREDTQASSSIPLDAESLTRQRAFNTSQDQSNSQSGGVPC